MKRRICALLLLIGMLALASCRSTKGIYEFEMQDKDMYNFDVFADHCEIARMNYPTTPEAKLDLVIPKEYMGKPITKIQESAFNEIHSIRSVTINQDIEIESYAFSYCYEIEQLIFNGNVVLHERSFFMGLYIKSITFNKSLGSVSGYFFSYGSSSAEHKLASYIVMEKTTLDRYSYMPCDKVTLGKEVTYQFVDTKRNSDRFDSFDVKENGQFRILSNYQEWKDYQLSQGSDFRWMDLGKDASYMVGDSDETARIYFDDSTDVSNFSL